MQFIHISFSFCILLSGLILITKHKCKVIHTKAWTGLYSPRRSRLPEVVDTRHMKVAVLSALRTGHLHPPGNIPSTHFHYRLSHSRGIGWPEGISQSKIPLPNKKLHIKHYYKKITSEIQRDQRCDHCNLQSPQAPTLLVFLLHSHIV